MIKNAASIIKNATQGVKAKWILQDYYMVCLNYVVTIS